MIHHFYYIQGDDCKKFYFIQELEEVITKINRKFRDSMDAYLHCATVYFKLNKCGKARFILQKALSNLPNKSRL